MIFNAEQTKRDIERMQLRGFAISKPAVRKRTEREEAARWVIDPKTKWQHREDITVGMSQTARRNLIRSVVAVVVYDYGCRTSVPYSNCRKGDHPEVRQMCAMLLRECLGLKHRSIADAMSWLDARSASRMVELLTARMRMDEGLRKRYEDLKGKAEEALRTLNVERRTSNDECLEVAK